MAKKERIRQIRKILDKHHKVTFNKLKEIVVEKKGLMAAQTFSDALKEGVSSGIIIREEGLDGKRRVVRYSNPENVKKEDEYYQVLINDVDTFYGRWEALDELFPELNNIEKGQFLFALIDWHYAIQAQISIGHSLFNSQKFADLAKDISSSIQELEKLVSSGDEKQQSIIWNELSMGWNDVERKNGVIIDQLLDVAIARQAR